MAGIFSRVSALAKSPQGKKLIKQAQEAAKDPANRAKVQELGNRLKNRAAGKPAQPGAAQPGATQPGSTEPGPAEPGVAQAGPAQSGATPPESAAPQSSDTPPQP